jgi:hypothetical protein
VNSKHGLAEALFNPGTKQFRLEQGNHGWPTYLPCFADGKAHCSPKWPHDKAMRTAETLLQLSSMQMHCQDEAIDFDKPG